LSFDHGSLLLVGLNLAHCYWQGLTLPPAIG